MSKIINKLTGPVSGFIIGGPSGALQGVTNVLAALSGPIGYGLYVASALLTPGTPGRQAAAATLQLGEVPRQAAFGRVASAGSLVDAFNHDGKYGTDFEVLVIALADHRCKGLVGVYVNDVYVAFAPTGDDIADQNGTVPGYNDQLRINWYPGTETQIVKQTLIDFGGWSAADKLAGVAHVVVHYKADDSKAKNPVWPGGRPRFLFVFDGAFCYDPRKDSTVAGGSGAHRISDPTTWEWSDNPIVCRYNWVRGIFACDRVGQIEQLLIGRGLSALEAPPENVAWRANICDEMVALAGGGSEKRYRFNGLIAANEQYLVTEGRFAATVAGVIKQPEGSVEVDPGHAVTPTFAITDDDFLIGAKKTFSAFRSKADNQWINTTVPRYTEPALKYVEHGAPIRRVYADLIEDEGAREATLTLPDVQSGTQAQRCAEIARRQGRLVRAGGGTLGPAFSVIEEGDWGVYTSARHTGGAAMGVRADAISVPEKWQNTLQLREMTADVFYWDASMEIADGSVATPNAVPVYGGAPGSGEWTAVGGIVAGTNGESLPAIILTGSAADPYATQLIVEYRQRTALLSEEGTALLTESGGILLAEGAAPDWIAEPSLAAATTSYTLRGLAAGGVFEVAISYLVRGVVGSRLILGPLIAGTLGVSRASYTIDTLVPAFPLTSDDTHIYVAAFTAVLDDSRSMMFPAMTFSGLANSTTYAIFWNLTTSAYETDLAPGLSRRASSDYVFIRYYSTSTGGVYPTSPSPPPGDKGASFHELDYA
jgi:hypothetical protein